MKKKFKKVSEFANESRNRVATTFVELIIDLKNGREVANVRLGADRVEAESKDVKLSERIFRVLRCVYDAEKNQYRAMVVYRDSRIRDTTKELENFHHELRALEVNNPQYPISVKVGNTRLDHPDYWRKVAEKDGYPYVVWMDAVEPLIEDDFVSVVFSNYRF